MCTHRVSCTLPARRILPSLIAPVRPTCSEFFPFVTASCHAALVSDRPHPHLPACLVCLLTVCRASCLLGVSCPRSLHLCGPRALNVLLLSQLDITLRSSLTVLTLTCMPAWYERTSCAIHLACSAVSCPRSLHLCGPRALNSFLFVTACAVMLRRAFDRPHPHLPACLVCAHRV
jgi:hypothetical protein